MPFLTKIFKAFIGGILFLTRRRTMDLRELFKGKRIAVIGAASSLFDHENGSYIDGFDYVIRINKAVYNLNEDNDKHLGKKTDILFHCFFENDISGGGKLDFEHYDKLRIEYVFNPRNTPDGWRTVFNFYKKYLSRRHIYTLPRSFYAGLQADFGTVRPTTGYAALYTALSSDYNKCFITGFTFFRTAYADGYRDKLKEVSINKKFIADQGIHDPDMEFAHFQKMIAEFPNENLEIDTALSKILQSEKETV